MKDNKFIQRKKKSKGINNIKKYNNHIKYRIFKVKEILTIKRNNLRGIKNQ